MLVSLAMHVTVYSYPSMQLAILLFLCSTLSLFGGFLMTRLVLRLQTAKTVERPLYQINLTQLRRVEWFLVGVSGVILIANFVAYGPPPLFTLLGANTLNYVEYGKLKQVLNAVTLALTVTVSLETVRRRKILLFSLSYFSMIAYATRGFLLLMLAQTFFVFCLQTRTSKRKLYVAAVTTVMAAVLLSNFIGNGRAESTSDAFVSFFGITNTYANWPMATLWVLSYVSTPISNICWIVHSYHYTGPSLTFLTTLLPAFWAPESLETQYLGSSFVIDGVHTYLAKYFLDLWYFGIVLINVIWGILAALLGHRNRLITRPLTSAVLLSAIVFIFFADFLTFLSVFMELAVLILLERYALLPRELQWERLSSAALNEV